MTDKIRDIRDVVRETVDGSVSPHTKDRDFAQVRHVRALQREVAANHERLANGVRAEYAALEKNLWDANTELQNAIYEVVTGLAHQNLLAVRRIERLEARTFGARWARVREWRFRNALWNILARYGVWREGRRRRTQVCGVCFAVDGTHETCAHGVWLCESETCRECQLT